MIELVAQYDEEKYTYKLVQQRVYFVDTRVCFEHIHYDMIGSSFTYKRFASIRTAKNIFD